MRSPTSLGHVQEAKIFLPATFLNKTSLTRSVFTSVATRHSHFEEEVPLRSPQSFWGCIYTDTSSPEPGQVTQPETCNHSSHCPVQVIQAANYI